MNKAIQAMKRGAALLLAAALILTLSPAARASEALGTQLRGRTDTVAPGVTVSDGSLWSAAYSDLRTEHYITYIPGGAVRPVVAYGSYVSDLRTLSDMAGTLEARGLRVAGGINAGFYVVKNGTPVGLVVSGGVLQSSGENFRAIGFLPDGSAVIGQPVIPITAQWVSREQVRTDEQGNVRVEPGRAESISISGFNKIREDGGFYLFSDTFAATTRNNVAGVDVILRPQETADPATGAVTVPAGLPMSGSVTCRVESVRASTPDNSIPTGCFVLSVNQNSGEERMALLSGLQEGDEVVLTTAAEGDWARVTEAVSGLYSLVENGRVAEGLGKDRNPYTAVGLREDGSVVLYTVDGRQSGYSVGATYGQVAARMIELGCVTAIAMDGGGSTSLGATFADGGSFRTVNRGSDGSPRRVSTCLLLAQPAGGGSGEPGGFYVTGDSDVVAAGGSLPLRVTAVDTEWFPMEWSGELTWQAGQGTVTSDGNGGWLYTARSDLEENLTDTVTVSGGGVSGSMQVLVVGSPGSIRVTREGESPAVAELRVKPGETVDLAASGLYYNLPVTGTDSVYTWAVSPEAGTVDETGRFTAGEQNAAGELTVSRGATSVTVPVVVESGNPFADVRLHWSRDYVTDLYRRGIVNGETGDDGLLYFYPDRPASRGELFTMVVRMLGVDTGLYDRAELPFADADSIPEWMLPCIRAAFGLGILTGSDHGDGLLYADINTPMTRETAMTIIGRTLGRSEPADLSGYADREQVSDWARVHVETLVALGVVQGSDGLLRPMGNITRGEIAKIISMAAQLRES